MVILMSITPTRLFPGCVLSWPRDRPLIPWLHYESIEMAFPDQDSLNDFYVSGEDLVDYITLVAFRLPPVSDLKRFSSLLENALPIAKDYNVSFLIIDPWQIAFDTIRERLLEIADLLLEEKICLCWNIRNDDISVSLIELVKEVPEAYLLSIDLPYLKRTEDTLLHLIMDLGGLVRVLHMSNSYLGHKGLPIFDSRGSLDYGSIIRLLKALDAYCFLLLDYADEYKHLYREDLLKVKEYILSPVV